MNDSVSSKGENVIPIQSGRSNRSGSVSLARLPAAMHSLRDRARQMLQQRLRELFDKADDALFELADQAGSNQEQNLYFDSMREVRLQRRHLEQAFFEQIDRGFAALLDTRASTASPADEEPSLDDLALVQNDELEQQVATESMVNRANEQHAEPIQHLTLRMDQLVPVKVYQKNNPLGADAVCTAFTDTAQTLAIDVKAKLVLFKLFERHITGQLGELYQQLNQQLIEANILPSLKAGAPAHKPRRGGSTGGAGGACAPESGAEREEASQVLHTLRDLLSGQPGQSGAGQGEPSDSGGGGAALGGDELMGLLSRAQQQAPAGTGEAGAPVDVSRLVREMAQNGNQSLNRVDEDVINLVSMMFEFILDDRNLAAPMKALIGRLQIPLIKVAITDKRFFSKGGHPARRLLNELAMAALGWQDSGEQAREKDPLYRKVAEIVQTILDQFESDLGIFEQMLLDLRAWQEKEQRRARILEQRTLDAEDGKARSERARAEVDAALERLTAGRELPEAARQLLLDAWAKVLFIVALKEGTDSEAWAERERTASDLVWSVTVPMNRDNRQRLLKLVPPLLSRLREGLESISFNPYEMTQLFKRLEKAHLDRLRGAATDGRPEQKKAVPTEEPEQAPSRAEADAGEQSPATEADGNEPESPTGKDTAEAPDAEPEARDESAEAEPEAPGEPSEAGPGADRVEASARPERQSGPQSQPESTPQAEQEPLSESDPHLALVSNLTQGSWFEIQGDQQVFRCRLAAMIKPTGKYIFVNRSGMKVAEESREGLARALKAGRMRLLDDSMLFDRALEAVIGNLRSARTGG